MYQRILAIDISNRVDDFDNRILGISKNPIIKVNNIEEAEKIIANHDDIDAILVSLYHSLDFSLLKKLRYLRYVGVLGSSTKKIATDYCLNNNIKVSSVIDYSDHETAEWVIFSMLKHFRYLKDPLSLYEKSVGVIGVGSVGRLVAKIAKAFGMKVFYNASNKNTLLEQSGAIFLDKEIMLNTCDVISLHTPAYQPILSYSLLSHAKENLVIINSCMGKISYKDDLENFLRQREDVVMIMDAIAGLSYSHIADRASISYEQAFYTIDSKSRLADKFLANIKEALVA